MDKMKNFNTADLETAVILWTGWKKEKVPKRDESALINHFGASIAVKILSEIKSLEDDFYSSDARFIAKDLLEMEKLSIEQFTKKHPGISEETAKAFAWCYSFDYK
ncbi:hypothetical protein LEP1GSC050_0533 [Leptospira broomii serovar Hurstbridge str. 5399]|uniref:Uncharacterized protein n=1 Tax=Leptospira broomii serovar Hurstbridge str. 5399 TaxID=1049789 RepID=T0EWC7_9LEPT|nr:hypothetical protein [Leptospira broomii]EQA43150.1 hypothetical protein LEP1GSC050_0533 [Leptospira broomii serovar Hurstbridge str. 5399]